MVHHMFTESFFALTISKRFHLQTISHFEKNTSWAFFVTLPSTGSSEGAGLLLSAAMRRIEPPSSFHQYVHLGETYTRRIIPVAELTRNLKAPADEVRAEHKPVAE